MVKKYSFNFELLKDFRTRNNFVHYIDMKVPVRIINDKVNEFGRIEVMTEDGTSFWELPENIKKIE